MQIRDMYDEALDIEINRQYQLYRKMQHIDQSQFIDNNITLVDQFQDLLEHYNIEDFIEELKHKIDTGKCKIYTDLLQLQQENRMVNLEYRFQAVDILRHSFVIVFEFNDQYFILSFNDDTNRSGLLPDVLKVYKEIIDYLIKYLENEDNSDQNDVEIIDVSSLQTYTSGVYQLGNELLSTVELSNNDMGFITNNDEFLNTNGNMIERVQYIHYDHLNNKVDDGEQRVYSIHDDIASNLDIDEMSDHNEGTNINEDIEADDDIEIEVDIDVDELSQEEQEIEELRNELSDRQWEQVVTIIDLLNQNLSSQIIRHHASQLGYLN